jgi:predicted O-methyltransferase YrrM
MSVYLKLVELYQKHGYTVRTGLYPPHFHNFKGASGTVLEKSSLKIRTGGGIALGEVYLLEELCRAVNPKSIFIIGNAFGWSTFAFALACPEAEVVALDAGVEGHDNMAGIHLTNQMAKEEGFRVRCIHGFSPQDVAKTVSANMSTGPDLVFIDGLHTDKQLLLDFEASHKVAPNALYLYHDVVNFRMQRPFEKIRSHLQNTHQSSILWRTFSGMGISVPKQKSAELQQILDAYTDDQEYIKTIRFRWRLLRLKSMLGPIGTLIERAASRFDQTLQKWTRG